MDDARVLSVQHLTARPMGEHLHAWHELIIIASGSYQVEVEGRTLRGGPGSSFLFRAAQTHRPRAVTAIHLYAVQWTGLDDLVQDMPVLGRDRLGRLEGTAQMLWEWHRASRTTDADRLALVRVMLRQHAPASLGPMPEDPVAKAQSILGEHGGRGLLLPALAEVVGLSPSQLTRRFKEATGLSPMAWRRRLRLRRAVAWVRAGQLSLAEIADRCGFASAAHLSNTLARLHGVRPRDLRGR